jgi:16S rRNA (cytidine1402-2'-O)-methyltransferase
VPGTLYLVGTPIGNLGDLSERARETLARVDLVACEDTRRTGRLLRAIGVSARLVSFFEGNEARRTSELLAALREGRDVALVSDAGMPALSDPGERLVGAAIEAGVEVRVVPGPSAAVAALVVSGLPTDRFVFEGFLPRKASERRARLQALAAEPRTLVLFESPRRVRALLRELVEVLGDRRVALSRELTKLHEEVLRGRASEVLAALGDRDPRGEVVLVVEGAPAPRPPIDEMLAEVRALVAGGMRRRDAAAAVARRRGASANELYRALLRDRSGSAADGGDRTSPACSP